MSDGIRILIVDDEPVLRRALERAVGHMGHEVRGAGDAHSAYQILSHESVDLVLMDLRLPDMPGQTLALALVRQWPELRGRIVLMSGDLGPETGQDWPTELRSCPRLAKPFGLDLLAQTIAAVLEAAAPPPLRRSNGDG